MTWLLRSRSYTRHLASLAASALLGGALLLGCGHPPPPTKPSPVRSAEPEATPAPAASAEAQSQHLRLCNGVWAPFTDVEGKPRIAQALVREALARAGVTVDTSIVGPSLVLPEIEAGKFDGSEALWKSPEREAYLYFSEPYFENRLVLVGRKGSPVTAKSVEELKGKKLGIVVEYAYGPEILDAKNVVLVRGNNDEDNLRALLEGKIDYTIVDDLLIHQLFAAEPKKAEERLAIGKEPIALRSLYFGLHKRVPHAQEILARFNEQMKGLRRDGTYNDLLAVQWLVTDADGDGNDELVLRGNQAGLVEPAHRYQLFGAPSTSAPRILIEGQVYQGWANVPDRFKVQPTDRLDTFVPGMQAVLVDF